MLDEVFEARFRPLLLGSFQNEARPYDLLSPHPPDYVFHLPEIRSDEVDHFRGLARGKRRGGHRQRRVVSLRLEEVRDEDDGREVEVSELYRRVKGAKDEGIPTEDDLYEFVELASAERIHHRPRNSIQTIS